MNQYERIKRAVTPKQAAERYGYPVGHNGMIRCPFHDDRHPSMKLYDDHYHCFGCQATGDVIDFAAKLFGISASDAAKKLAADFGIEPQRFSIMAELKRLKTAEQNERFCRDVLRDYEALLSDWKRRYHPASPADKLHPKYVQALRLHDDIGFMLDEVMLGTQDERQALVAELMKDGKAEKMRKWIDSNKEESVERV